MTKGKKRMMPEERLERRLKPLCLKEADVCRVLAFLARRVGIGAVVKGLKGYFWDKTDGAFDAVTVDRSDYSLGGLGAARGWDVCAALLECLEAKIKESGMERKGVEK